MGATQELNLPPPQEPLIDITEFNPSEHEWYATQLADAEQSTNSIINTRRAYRTGAEGARTALERIKLYNDDLVVDYRQVSSSQAVGAAYQHLRSEWPAVPFHEFNDFFQSVIRIYAGAGEMFGRQVITKDDFEGIMKSFPTPSWFKGNKNAWTGYIKHLLSSGLELVDPAKYQGAINKEEMEIIPEIFSEYLPDWFEELATRTNSEEELTVKIQTELEEDTSTRNQLGEAFNKLREQVDRSQEYFLPKGTKQVQWMTEMNDSILDKSVQDIRSWLLYLSPAFAIRTDDPYGNFDPSTDPVFLDIYSQYFLDNTQNNTDLIAVWLDQGVTGLGIREDSLTRGFMAQAVAQNQSNEWWYDLKQRNKKVHNFLKFQILPLLSTMTPDEREILAEELQTFPLDESLRDLAGNITAHQQELAALAAKDSSLQKVITDVRKSGKKYLIENYNPLRKKLVSRITNKPVTEIQGIQEETGYKPYEPNGTKAEPESSFFNGWSISYTTSIHNPDSAHVIPLTGTSFKDASAEFQNILRSARVPLSIKPESVLNCLKQIITTPEEIEYFTPHLGEQYSSVDYKKRKRGNARILYTMDPKSKSLVFWLYQKKSFKYRLN